MSTFPSFDDHQYLKAPKIYPTDHLLKYLILWALPRSVTPNQITLLRFIMIPPVIILLALQNYAWGVPLFLLAALTDAMDGALARTRHMVTEWGMMFDPLADKLLIVPSAIILIVTRLDVYLAAAVIIMEFIIIIAAFMWHQQGRVVQANIWGKIKMCLQVSGIVTLLITAWLHYPLTMTAEVLLIASVGFGMMSLLRYGS